MLSAKPQPGGRGRALCSTMSVSSVRVRRMIRVEEWNPEINQLACCLNGASDLRKQEEDSDRAIARR